jgi:ribosomal protein S18 acetylase RimI-like enzyme
MILIREPGPIAGPDRSDIELRAPVREDTLALARLYFEAYDPGIASSTEAEAIEDIELTFNGGYGVLDVNLSRLAWSADQLVGAALVVERAPWPDTPDCPFVIELFTARAHRRRGLAQLLLTACATVSIALRVDKNNTPALTLYDKLGFHPG